MDPQDIERLVAHNEAPEQDLGAQLTDPFDPLEDFDFAALGQNAFDWEQNDQFGNDAIATGDLRPTITYEQDYSPPSAPAEPQGQLLEASDVAFEQGNDQGYNGAFSTEVTSVAISGCQTPPYQNEILNRFADASIPLRAIDEFYHPFPNTLKRALQFELTASSKRILSQVNRKLEAESNHQGGELDSNTRYQQQYRGPTPGESASTVPHNQYQQTRKRQHQDDFVSHQLQSNKRNKSNPGWNPHPQSLASGASQWEAQPSMFQPRPQMAFDYSILGGDKSAGQRPRLAVPQQTPLSRSETSTPGSRKPQNRRGQNFKAFDPAKYYEALPHPPASWTARPQPPAKHAPTTFEYTIHGELTPARRFTTQEISDYLEHHPLHRGVGAKDSYLRIWIQNTPADSRSRYPTSDSAKCRFEACVMNGGTIRTGEYRLCFDELSHLNKQLNPYHNAGYVHLYCMEKNFNFHQLFQEFNVRPDDRRYQHETTNRMAITRDHQSMIEVCEAYKARDPSSMPVKKWDDVENKWFEKSLTRALTCHHIESEGQAMKKMREARGGFNIADYLGDLQKLADYRAERNEAMKAEKKEAGPSARPKKRKRRGEVEELEDSDERESDREERGNETEGSLFVPDRASKKRKTHR